jgi:hypothetical protein
MEEVRAERTLQRLYLTLLVPGLRAWLAILALILRLTDLPSP